MTFKIFYETKFGEHISVVGSIPELGEWEQEKSLKLVWTDGHYWTNPEPLLVSDPYFFYKYQFTDEEDEELLVWERGIDRIADLRILPCKQAEYKEVTLTDTWEQFQIRFTVFDAFHKAGDKISLMQGLMEGDHI